MGSVFISYRSVDFGFVDLLHRGLIKSGYDVWLDRGKLVPSDQLSDEIERGIEESSAIILVVSDAFRETIWPANELAYAQDLKKTIIPIVFKGAPKLVRIAAGLQIKTDDLDATVSAAVLINILDQLDLIIGPLRERDHFADWICSSDDEMDPLLEMRRELIGTRWSWCENDRYEIGAERHNIEFRADEVLICSWDRTRPRTWKLLEGGLVIYKPHVLKFDFINRRFAGAVADPKEPNPARTGYILSKL